MRVIERDVLCATAPLQVCVGVPFAYKAAILSMDRLFRDFNVQGIFLTDASNAFNSFNRPAALHNVPHCCPALAQIFQNMYIRPIRLFVANSGEILSQEGTCQGNPLKMAIYAVSTIPFIKGLAGACLVC